MEPTGFAYSLWLLDKLNKGVAGAGEEVGSHWEVLGKKGP